MYLSFYQSRWTPSCYTQFMLLGTTYSHQEIECLKLDNEQAFDELLLFDFDIIRLCCYWSESEPEKNTFGFSKIEKLLDKCEKSGQKIVMTIGMKSPRWPEFYIPSWLEGCSIPSLMPQISLFFEKAVEQLERYSCIEYWQVENEPLDKSGPDKLSITAEMLKQEIKLIKALDSKRPIIVNAWMNHIKKNNLMDTLTGMADIIGFDIYYKIPTKEGIYIGPKNPLSYFQKQIKLSQKPVWITELQAEPWEKDEIEKMQPNPPSMSPALLKENFEKTKSLNPAAILFWGYEYWYLRKEKDDKRLWNCVRDILSKEKN